MAHSRAEAMALAPHDDSQRAAQVRLADRQRRLDIGTDHPDASDVKVRQRTRQVVHGCEKEVLDRPSRSLDRRRRKGRLASRRKHHAVSAGGFRAAQQGTDVLRVLERIEDKDEGRLVALQRARQDRVNVDVATRCHDQGDPLVAVEAGHGCQGPALDLDDRDTQARGVQNQPFECLATLGDDQQSTCLASGDERLFDGPATGDQLIAHRHQVVRNGGGYSPRPAGPWQSARGRVRTTSGRSGWRRAGRHSATIPLALGHGVRLRAALQGWRRTGRPTRRWPGSMARMGSWSATGLGP